jgi:pyruvate formate lyase activating enzyme
MASDLGQLSPEKFIRPALLQEPVLRAATGSKRPAEGTAGRRIRCLTCERRCEIPPGGLGWCRTRRHHDGELVTLIYGAVSSLSCNPIEKKPLYHFYPGSLALTVGSFSCNLDCPWCQNYGISKAAPGRGRYMSPEDFVLEAVNRQCRGTSISFNEPTLSLEWSLEVFDLARARGLYDTFVSNGYMTSEALRLLTEAGLDAVNVDIKGDTQAVGHYCGTDVEKVWRNCALAVQAGVWLEVTTLVIPGVNDSDVVLGGIAGRIAADLGPDVPWHVSGYYPAYHFTAPPTPLRTLERAWCIGHEAGLRFVYLGNVSGTARAGHRLESTYCPDCETLLIRRWGLGVTGYYLAAGHCARCGRAIPGVWGSPKSLKEPLSSTPPA